MREREHLPWVSGPDGTPPRVSFDARGFIRSARRRAFLGDLIDVSLLLVVDLLVASWAGARFPFFTRADSLAILVLLNVALIGSFWLRRRVNQWRARRVAATWTNSERERVSL